MIQDEALFNHLVRQTWEAGFSGWDFPFVEGRMLEQPLDWDYHQIV
jgi:hypothetical protein